mmetsp:Transcript_18949/g.55656  ORF Transcript_18949/g.55656 Transcript_18949/m.55656 type:complete len:508 (+) Transcript_18949:408-1931(+)
MMVGTGRRDMRHADLVAGLLLEELEEAGALAVVEGRDELLELAAHRGEGVLLARLGDGVGALLEESADGLVVLPRDLVGLGELLELLVHLRARELPASHGGEELLHLLLADAALEAPVEVLPRVLPVHHLADDALGLHAAGAVVEVGELVGHLKVEGQERVLARVDLLLRRLDVRSHGERVQLGAELLNHRVVARHELEQVGLAELDVADARGLEDAAARVRLRVHLHHLLVDGRVHHHPRPSTQLAVRGNVDKDGRLVLAERVDDVGAVLEHLTKHVARAAREAAPVRKDEDGQLLAVVEVVESLRRLEGRVREPHLARLLQHHLRRGRVGRVRGDARLSEPRLHGDHAHGLAAEARASHDHRLAPLLLVLGPGALVEEAGERAAVRVDGAAEEVARVVGRLGGLELDGAVHRVRGGARRRHVAVGLGHEAEPLDHLPHGLLVVRRAEVGDAVGQHDLRPAELVLARVHLAAEKLVERRKAREDDGALVLLDHALAEAVEVGADAD